VVFTLFIINKAGGLIYNREFHSGLTQLNSNDLLTLAALFRLTLFWLCGGLGGFYPHYKRL
jgi:hypothetical protein